MRKLLYASIVIISVSALASCGNSKKLGCPSVAKNVIEQPSQKA